MAIKLEVFETGPRGKSAKTVVIDAMQLEETKLASYDSGYSAGWEDSIAAQANDQGQIKAELSRNLQGLGFTYHEARNHVLKSLRPLLTEIIGRLLPAISRESLAPIVLENLLPLAETHSEVPVELRLHPATRAAVETLLEGSLSFPLKITEEPSLGESQVYLKLGASEVQIDLDRVIEEIRTAVASFFDAPIKENRYE